MSGVEQSRDGRQPYFSVLVPSYNRPEYIAECVQSILANDFDDYEIVVSDDLSPRAAEIEAAIQPFRSLANFRFFRQTKNLGEPDSRNFLVGQARGRYNIILGDDDLLFAHTLRRIKSFIEDHPDFDLYAFGYRVIDEVGHGQYSRFAPRSLTITPAQPGLVEEVLLADMFPFWLYHPATFCCRRGVEVTIPYSRRAGIGDDFLFMVDFLNAERALIVIPEVLFSWRKVTRPPAKGQINQSYANMANLKARRNIYYVLKQRTDLRPGLERFVATPAFRSRFLYDQVLADATLTAQDLGELQLVDEDRAALEQRRKATGPFLRRRMMVGRVFRFVRLFGMAGLLHVMSVARQRLTYGLRA